ncbi:MAG: YesL family protein [Stackebrandtia sp.]
MSAAQAGMRLGDWTDRLHAPMRWACRLAAVNLLWIAGTVAGLVVAGVSPSTVSACYLLREYHLGRSPRPWRDFWRVWRSEFAGAQVRLGVPLATAVVLLFYVAGVGSTDGPLAEAFAIALAVLTGLYIATLAFLPAVLAHFLAPAAAVWKLTALAAWRRPFAALGAAGVNAVLVTLMVTLLPAALPLFGFSLPAYIACRVAHRGLDRIVDSAPGAFTPSCEADDE